MSNRELLHHLAAEKRTLILFLPSSPQPAIKRGHELLIRKRRRQATLFQEVLAIRVVSSSDQ
jgi:hypothetical protein